MVQMSGNSMGMGLIWVKAKFSSRSSGRCSPEAVVQVADRLVIQTEVIVAKQRNGPVGTLRMTFLGELTRFEATADEGYWDGAE